MDKKFKNGLVLGKLAPPHLGHVHLIESAVSQCEMTHVMICSDDTQPIKGHLRYKWLLRIFKNRPEINIIWCQDENPQYPHECESLDIFYNKYWVPSVYRNIKELDVVFTSEAYGDEFATYLGIKHVCVDQARTTYPVSGTAVRENPYKYWNLIPDVVKRYYMKKVVIMGLESTGKSTLVKNLAEYFKCNYVEEYGRTYTDKIPAKTLTISDFDKIASGHSRRILKAEPTKILFVDTEAITTKIFAEMYLEEPDTCVMDFYIKKQHFNLYLLLDVDVPWVGDGTRDFPERRLSHLNRLKEELISRGIPYVLISGTYQERFEKSCKEVEKLGYLFT